MSQLEKDIAAIANACKPGRRHTWSPTAETRVTRQNDGRVLVEVRDQNRAVYNALYSHVRAMGMNNQVEDLQPGSGDRRWSFSFQPVH